MKYFILVALIFLTTNCLSQIDTIRTYFQDGSVYTESPQINGRTFGKVRSYYFNGQLKSESDVDKNYKSKKNIRYHKNGEISMLLLYKNNYIKKGKFYDEQGNLQKMIANTKSSRKIKMWYRNGNLSFKEIYSNGQPIGCISLVDSMQKEDTIKKIGYIRESCYCGSKLVIWKDDLYVDALTKNPIDIKNKFKYKMVEYYESGNKKKKLFKKKD